MSRKLLILATTYPRWENDNKSPFVQEFARQVAKDFDQVTVLVPHYKGAKRKEADGDLQVRRFRYAWPARYQNIVYEEHAGQAAQASLGYAIKLGLFMISQFIATLRLAPRGGTINVHWIIPHGLTAIIVGRLKGCKVVVTIHGSDITTLNGSLMRKVKAWILKRADEVVVNSTFIEQRTKEIYEHDYHIIPMGTDTELFKPAKKKSRHNLQAVFVGRLSSEKGAQYAIEAFHILQKVHPKHSWSLSIVGAGVEEQRLKELVAQHKLEETVSFTGWLPLAELPHVLTQSDIFIGPAIKNEKGVEEALGLTFAEAMACGVPVITTKVGGITDLVDESDGFVVPQKDAKAIAEILEQIDHDQSLLQKLSKNSRQKIIDDFSWESVKKRYLPLLRG